MNTDFFKKREFKIFLIVCLVYIFFISEYSGDWISDSTLSETLSLVNDYDFAADNYVKEGCKEVGCDYAFYNGHFYSGFAPGASLLAVPLLFLFKPLFMALPDSVMSYGSVHLNLVLANILVTIFIAAVLGALLAVLVYSFSKHLTKSKKIRLLITFSFAFGTFSFLYSTGYTPRLIATFFSFYAFYLLFKNKHFGLNNKSLFIAGLSVGFAVFTDYTQAIMAFLLSIYLFTFLRNKRVFYFILGGFLVFLALISYHYFIFGDPFTTAFSHRADVAAAEGLESGFYSMRFPTLKAVWGLSFSPEKGLFIYVPIFILSLLGFFLVLTNRRHKYFIEVLLVFLIFLGLFLYNASEFYPHWKANCSFGPRHLTGVLPFLMIPLVFAYEKVRFKIAAVFAGVSIFVNFLPVLYGRTVLWRSFVGVGCNSQNAIFKEYIPLIFERGLTNYTLNLIKFKFYDLPVYLMNFITLCGLILLGFLIWFIWKKR